MTRRVLIAGTGDVGTRLARQLAARGDTVFALRRTPTPDARPDAGGVRHVVGDLTDPDSLAPLVRSLPGELDALVYLPAPGERSEAAYRALFLDGSRHLLAHLGRLPRRVLFVSSTAVYGEDAGERIDDASAPAPQAFNGRVLLEAERWLSDAAGATAVRFSGLYGPGRERMLRRAQAGDPGAPRWGNRLHVDDAAAVLAHLLDADALPAAVVASDLRPERDDRLLAWLRTRCGWPAVAVVDDGQPETGRRIAPSWLVQAGFAWKYPDYSQGYASIMSDGCRQT